jgi:hypothetical protein
LTLAGTALIVGLSVDQVSGAGPGVHPAAGVAVGCGAGRGPGLVARGPLTAERVLR